MIVTIDGPAGSGKSAAAYRLATRLGWPFLDTGAMYRAVALDALEKGVLHDPAGMAARAREMNLDFHWDHQPPAIWIDDRDITDEIRRPRVTEVTYLAADNPDVRAELVRRQRAIAERLRTLVSEGRDQGSIVFPNAEFKFYLDADSTERAHRRIVQMRAKGLEVDENEIRAAINLRDYRDRVRQVGPLMRPSDSRLIDTTTLTLDEVVDLMAKTVEAARHNAPASA
jgi:cytidylate kinase